MADGRFGVCGSGTMGIGIAYAAALAGYDTWVYDISDEMLARGTDSLARLIDGAVQRSRLSREQAGSVRARLHTTSDLQDLARCSVVVEAIIEQLAAKQSLFVQLESIVAGDAMLASNTSSLAITAIASRLRHPERCVGLHFFNPAHVMKLVEVVQGVRTSVASVQRAVELVEGLGKTAVRASDTPGFIVNRVARNFYGEALRIVGEGATTPEQVDRCMRAIGFRMGPFELMDLIGIDVNLMVTQSVFDQFFQEPRFRPHPIQQRMVDSGRLGTKSGGGFYQGGSQGSGSGDPG